MVLILGVRQPLREMTNVLWELNCVHKVEFLGTVHKLWVRHVISSLDILLTTSGCRILLISTLMIKFFLKRTWNFVKQSIFFHSFLNELRAQNLVSGGAALSINV